MHPVLTRRRGEAGRLAGRGRCLVALVVAAVVTMAGAGPAAGEYATVENRLRQSVWARVAGQSAPPVTAAVVRGDGRLIVASSPDQRAARGHRTAGGNLHLVDSESTVLDASNRFGPTTFGFARLAIRKGRLYGLSITATDVDEIGQKARLIELDLGTGAVLRDLGLWWWPELAVDPATQDLVLYAFDCSGRCRGDAEQAGSVTHPLVRFDPDSGRRTTIVPDRPTLESDAGSPCAQPDLRRCEDPFRAAITADGSAVVLVSTRPTNNVAEVRSIDGRLVRRFAVPRPADSIALGTADSCLSGTLLLSIYDGSMLAVGGVLTGGSDARVVAAGAPSGSTAMTVAPDGSVVATRRSEVGRLACPDLAPLPRAGRPDAAAAPGATPASPVSAASAPASGQSGAGGSATPPAAPTGGPPPAPPAPPTPVAAGPPAHGVQAVTSPAGALADAPEEQPVFGLSASARAVPLPGRAALAATALLLVAGAWFVIDLPAVRRAAHIRQERP